MELARWKTFSKHDQLLMIGSEIMRAGTWQRKDEEKFTSALERAFALVDLSLTDSKWGNMRYPLLFLRSELAEFYAAERTDDIVSLYNAL